MDSLSQEVIELIVSFCDDDTRWCLLTVSHRFHLAVERFNWREYENPYNLEDLGQFLALYQGHRSRFLRYITKAVERTVDRQRAQCLTFNRYRVHLPFVDFLPESSRVLEKSDLRQDIPAS